MADENVCTRKRIRGSYCLAAWCSNFHGCRVDKPISFFTMPKEEWRANAWLKFALREELMGTNYKNWRLCSDHFLPKDFKATTPRTLLMPDAIPTVTEQLPEVTVLRGGSSNKIPKLETDPLRDANRLTETASPPRAESFLANGDTRGDPLRSANRLTETASPPHEELFTANEDSVHLSSEVDIKPDVDTIFTNETEQMAGLEADSLRGASRITETASPPPEEACPADEDSIHSSSEVDIKPDVDPLLNNETEQMRADRERIMKHPYECCRLCLERNDDLTDVCKGTELGLVVKQAIKDYLHFEVVRNGELPWQVCSTCMQTLSYFQEFKDRCVETKILWDVCSKYFDEEDSADNTRRNATQTVQHNESDTLTVGTFGSIKLEPMDEEETENEVITPPYEDENVSMDNSVIDVGDQINNKAEIAVDYNAIYETEDSIGAEVDDKGCESRHNLMHNQRALVHHNTQPSSMWLEDKENSTADQVKGMYALDDAKGIDGEPSVLILKEDGAVELCTMSEIPLNMRAGIQKYSKTTEKLIRKRPRGKRRLEFTENSTE